MVIVSKDGMTAFDITSGYKVYIYPALNAVYIATMDGKSRIKLGEYSSIKKASCAFQYLCLKLDAGKTPIQLPLDDYTEKVLFDMERKRAGVKDA